MFSSYVNVTHGSVLTRLLKLYGNRTLDGAPPRVFPRGWPPAGLKLPPNTTANFNYTCVVGLLVLFRNGTFFYTGTHQVFQAEKSYNPLRELFKSSPCC